MTYEYFYNGMNCFLGFRLYESNNYCFLLYGFSARIGSPVNTGSDWPSLLIAETSNWYR